MLAVRKRGFYFDAHLKQEHNHRKKCEDTISFALGCPKRTNKNNQTKPNRTCCTNTQVPSICVALTENECPEYIKMKSQVCYLVFPSFENIFVMKTLFVGVNKYSKVMKIFCKMLPKSQIFLYYYSCSSSYYYYSHIFEKKIIAIYMLPLSLYTV